MQMLRRKHSTGGLIVAGLAMMAVASAAPRSFEHLAEQSGQPTSQQSTKPAAKLAKPIGPPPNFAHDVAPILYRNCVSCHRPGESAPFSLLNYQDAKKHAEQIAAATESRYMPPWLPAAGYSDFAGEHRLTAEEITLIANWVKNGAIEGPASETPPAPSFTEGWQLGPPDLVVEATRAYTIPARGPDVFYNFIFSPGISATKYVRAIEIRPGNTHLIHHANVIVDRARSARRQETEPGAGFPGMNVKIVRNVYDFDTHFLFWKPGGAPFVEQDGFSWRLDPGNDLVLNAHIMTMGMPEEVKPSIGLYFTDKPPKYAPILIQLDRDGALNIPPGDPDFVVTDRFTLPLDADALAVYPHAHYFGHILESYAILPSGERKQLILIRHWDPKWQAVYNYREPVFLPKGTVLVMRWHYDNSAGNPRNPHRPPRRVFSGNQSTDEMAHLSFQLLPREPGQRGVLEEALMRHQLEKYPDDFQAHLWLGALKISRMDPGGAVSVFREAVKLQPDLPEGHSWLGVALGAIGLSNEAIEQFRIALKIQPDYIPARYNLAKTLACTGQFDEAAQDFAMVVAAFPADAQVRNDFGELYLRMGKPGEALEQFNKALAANPSHPAALKNRDLAQQQLAGR
jgi:tetratricopeptide (TPR) repeat protein/mono/diheme cytochrome c family protein